MKNVFKSLGLVLFAIFLVTSCESKPEAKPVADPVTVEDEVEDEVEEPSVAYDDYTVVKGDTLSQIAERFYGSKDKAYFFPIIIVNSLDTVSILDPDTIEPGMSLRVPSFDEFMASPKHTDAAKVEFEKDAVLYEKKGRNGVARMLRERSDRM